MALVRIRVGIRRVNLTHQRFVSYSRNQAINWVGLYTETRTSPCAREAAVSCWWTGSLLSDYSEALDAAESSRLAIQG
jgi:hypothetical protein